MNNINKCFNGKYSFARCFALLLMVMILTITRNAGTISASEPVAEQFPPAISTWFTSRDQLVFIPNEVEFVYGLGKGYPRQFDVLMRDAEINFVILNPPRVDKEYVTYISSRPITIRQALNVLNLGPVTDDDLEKYKEQILIPKAVFAANNMAEVHQVIDDHISDIDNAHFFSNGMHATRMMFRLGANLKGANVRTLTLADIQHAWGENGVIHDPDVNLKGVETRMLCWPTHDERRKLQKLMTPGYAGYEYLLERRRAIGIEDGDWRDVVTVAHHTWMVTNRYATIDDIETIFWLVRSQQVGGGWIPGNTIAAYMYVVLEIPVH